MYEVRSSVCQCLTTCILLSQGWSIKIADDEDLKPSVVAGNGKRQRIMQTIGVSRGFGDFDLKVIADLVD